MNDITIFANPQFGEIRTVVKEGEPHFVLADLCSALKLTNSRMVAERLSEDMKGVSPIYTPGGVQMMATVSEAGLYEVVIRSDKPEAVAFRRWITTEVLPSIRKHGAYMTPETLERVMSDPDFLIGILNGLKVEQAKRIQAETKIAELAPKAEFYDTVGSIGSGLTISDMAKLLGVKKVGPGVLFRMLKEHGVLMHNNRPYQEFIDRGLLAVRETVWYDPQTGEPRPHIQPVVLGKGQDWMRKFVETHA